MEKQKQKLIDLAKITVTQLISADIDGLLLAIQAISVEVDSHDKTHFKRNIWEWQYDKTPGGKSLVYVAKYDERIIGYYHIPVYFGLVNGSNYRIGVVQTVGILREFRKYGVFRLLADFANNDMFNHVDFSFTFPNQKSIKTFIKYNSYSRLGIVPAYILPFNISKIIESRTKYIFLANPFNWLLRMYSCLLRRRLTKEHAILSANTICEKVEKLYANFSKNYNIKITRNFNYFNWRYLKFPQRNYRLIYLKKGNTVEASVFISIQDIFSSQGIVVMDLAYSNYDSFEILISNIRDYLIESEKLEINFIYMASFFKDSNKLINCGFFRIPNKFNPRPLNFLIKKFNIKSDVIFNKKNWFLTLGDWDVF